MWKNLLNWCVVVVVVVFVVVAVVVVAVAAETKNKGRRDWVKKEGTYLGMIDQRNQPLMDEWGGALKGLKLRERESPRTQDSFRTPGLTLLPPSLYQRHDNRQTTRV